MMTTSSTPTTCPDADQRPPVPATPIVGPPPATRPTEPPETIVTNLAREGLLFDACVSHVEQVHGRQVLGGQKRILRQLWHNAYWADRGTAQ